MLMVRAKSMGSGGSSGKRAARQAALRQAFVTYRATGSLAALEGCIEGYRLLIPTLDETKVEHGNAVLDLAQLFGTRWALTRSDVHWAEAEEKINAFRARIPQSDWREPLYALAQGALLYQRADATEAPEDIADALGRLQEARAMVRRGSFVDRFSSGYQSNLRLRRYEAKQDPVDLEAALADASAVLTSEGTLQPHIVSAAKAFARAASLHADLVRNSGYTDFAIDSVHRALTLTVDPVEVGDLQSVLGSLLRQRFSRDSNAADIDDAIEAYRAAAQQPGLPNALRAPRTDNLGNGLAVRYAARGDDADLDAMIACGKEALDLFPADSPARARTHANLGRSLIACWRKRRDTAVLAAALDVLKAGVRIEGTQTSVIAMLNDALLETYLETDAATATDVNLDQAIAAGEEALRASMSSEGDDPVVYRLTAHAQSRRIVRRLVGALLRRAAHSSSALDRDLRRAVALGEAAKVPLLTRELLRRSLRAPAGADEGQIFVEKQKLAELAAYDVHEMAPADNLSEARRLRRIAQRRKAWSALERVWDEIAATGPEGSKYVHVRRDLSAALDVALQNRPQNWLVLSTLDTEELSPDGRWKQECCVIALPPGKVRPEVLCTVPDQLVPATQKLFLKEVLDVPDGDPHDETWWHELGALLHGKRADIQTQILFSATSGGLNLPWQLLFERSGWRDANGIIPTTVVVPSLVLAAAAGASGEDEWHVLRDAAKEFGIQDEYGLAENIRVTWRMPAGPSKGALVVGDPSRDLAQASDEAANVAQALVATPLLGGAANIKAVREGFRDARIVHIAAHATFNGDDPLASVLHLADGELFARDLVGSWSTSELVVLSACESGAGAPILGGEVLGLAIELLRSGVQEVIASIWPVDDAATAYLMQSFYTARAGGLSSAQALARAMSDTQAQPGWSRPYYWAGFVLAQRGWGNRKGGESQASPAL
jgi:hypothetical protein